MRLDIQIQEDQQSTESKIKEAAKRVFTRKGFAATRTRDIAEESGYNIALLNYYFRSKEKLFDLIMQDHIDEFVLSVMDLLNDKETSLNEKMELLVEHYIDMLIQNPNMPIFVLQSLHSDPEKFAIHMGSKLNIRGSHLAFQFKELMKNQPIAINPLHILMNTMGLIIFPFVASPGIRNRAGLNMDQFNALMEERKKLIPIWIKAILESSRNKEISKPIKKAQR